MQFIKYLKMHRLILNPDGFNEPVITGSFFCEENHV